VTYLNEFLQWVTIGAIAVAQIVTQKVALNTIRLVRQKVEEVITYLKESK